MKKEEFEKYQGKPTFGKDNEANSGKYIFDNGTIVGYADDEIFDGQCLITKIPDGKGLNLVDDEAIIPDEKEREMFKENTEEFSYFWCWRKNVKL